MAGHGTQGPIAAQHSKVGFRLAAAELGVIKLVLSTRSSHSVWLELQGHGHFDVISWRRVVVHLDSKSDPKTSFAAAMLGTEQCRKDRHLLIRHARVHALLKQAV